MCAKSSWTGECPPKNEKRFYHWLIQENLLNEARFASAFANDRFRFRKWGAAKIRQALQRKGVSAPIIAEAMKRLPATDQKETALELAQKKCAICKEIIHCAIRQNSFATSSVKGLMQS
jgi:regulatory protein